MKNVEIYNNNILMVKNYCMYRMLCKENQFQTQEYHVYYFDKLSIP